MLENLKKLNPEINFFDVTDKEFAPFGRIIKTLDAKEIIEVAKKIENPESGSSYVPACEAFPKGWVLPAYFLRSLQYYT